MVCGGGGREGEGQGGPGPGAYHADVVKVKPDGPSFSFTSR